MFVMHADHVLNKVMIRKDFGFEEMFFYSLSSALEFDEMIVVHDLEITQFIAVFAIDWKYHAAKVMGFA